MTKCFAVPKIPQPQTEEEYLAELDAKPIADLDRGDLLWLAEERHLANLLIDLFADDDVVSAGGMKRLYSSKGKLEEAEKVFGMTAMQEIYDEVERSHAGEAYSL